MPRSGKITKRPLEQDPLYHSRLITRFINRIMKNGEKTVAQKIVYGALEKINEKTKEDPLKTFETAMRNVAPQMEVRPRRVGGASYQVPMEVRLDRREALAIRWIIEAAKSRPTKEYIDRKDKRPVMSSKLAAELIDAAQNLGTAIKKRENTHRMAEANKAFAHFRW